MCSQRGDVRAKSQLLMLDEMQRCDALGLPWLNIHPGSPGKVRLG